MEQFQHVADKYLPEEKKVGVWIARAKAARGPRPTLTHEEYVRRSKELFKNIKKQKKDAALAIAREERAVTRSMTRAMEAAKKSG